MRFRKVCSFIISMLLCLSLFAASSADQITLPSSITAVEDEAFYGDQSLTDLIIPEGLLVIGSKAFAYTLLQSVTMPKSLRFFPADTFEGCPDGLTISVYRNSSAAFLCEQYGITHCIIEDEDPSRAVVTFIFDDGVKEDAQIVSVFDSHALKCGFAIPANMKTNARCNDYLNWQSRGYSILSHGLSLHDTDTISFSNPDTSPDVIRNVLQSSKERLESCGFNIAGWVTPSSQLAEEFRSILRQYYDYGYTVYYGSYKHGISTKAPYNMLEESPYNLYRIDLMSGAANVKAAIDLAITNNGILTIYCHAWSMQTSHFNDLETVLNYIEERMANNEIKCLSPNLAYRYFFSE